MALKDLKAVERSWFYKVNMNRWHTPEAFRCQVCLAGAVMAKELKIPFYVTADPDAFDDDTFKKLGALDNFRRGKVLAGLGSMGLWKNTIPPAIPITPYKDDVTGFYRDMNRLADDLEEAGL